MSATAPPQTASTPTTTTEPTKNVLGLSPVEFASMLTTFGMVIVLTILAWFSSHNQWVLMLAISVGGLGGLAHEIAQSGGKILFFKKEEDGLYLGSITGIVLGGV